MSETTTRALRPNAFVPNVRRFTLEIIEEPIPTKAEALKPSFWSGVVMQPRDVVTIQCSDGKLDVLVDSKAAEGWKVRPL